LTKINVNNPGVTDTNKMGNGEIGLGRKSKK